MSPYFHILIACLVATTFTLSVGNAAQPPSFQAGIEAYEQGAYETAKTEFSNALEVNETSAARHNLGLTELQLGNPAEAIWHLERALLLNPSNPDYRKKRDLVRRQLGLGATTPPWHIQISRIVSSGAWTIIATVSFWILLTLMVWPRLNGKKIDLRMQLIRIFSLLVLVLSLVAVWLNLKLLQSGIVVSNETASLNAAPATAAPETGYARPGERARILDQYNDFYQIETEGSATGWISKEAFRPLVDY